MPAGYAFSLRGQSLVCCIGMEATELEGIASLRPAGRIIVHIFQRSKGIAVGVDIGHAHHVHPAGLSEVNAGVLARRVMCDEYPMCSF